MKVPLDESLGSKTVAHAPGSTWGDRLGGTLVREDCQYSPLLISPSASHTGTVPGYITLKCQCGFSDPG